MGHVFISYSHRDKAYVHQLADALQAEGIDVWADDRLDYGSRWPAELQRQLDACSAFIVVMTPRSFESEWVQNELSRAKRKNKPIFPLLLEGNELWLSIETTQYVDVRGGRLPDARFLETLRRTIASAELQEPEPYPGALVGQIPEEQEPPGELPVVGEPKVMNAEAAGASLAPARSARRWNLWAIIGATFLVVAFCFVLAIVATVVRSPLFASLMPNGLAPTQVSTSTANSLPTSLAISSAPASTATSEPVLTQTEALQATPQVFDPHPATDDFHDSQGVPMRLVTAGTFTMGSERQIDEKPIHQVYLDAYYIDKYEVTNGLYQACVDAGVCQPPHQNASYTRPNYFGNPEFDNYPVISVNWSNAKAYCEWRDMRLPTEAEWEKAARGTGQSIYPWGDQADCSKATYHSCNNDTTEVGSHAGGASSYGLYDMSGNVWEQVADWYQADYYATLGDNATNPQGPLSGQSRVVRGGSWNDDGLGMTVSRRAKINPGENNGYIVGFRCARDAQP